MDEVGVEVGTVAGFPGRSAGAWVMFPSPL